MGDFSGQSAAELRNKSAFAMPRRFDRKTTQRLNKVIGYSQGGPFS
jgi:hypothetical protein